MAIPADGDPSYAPSLLSAPVLYNHKGRLYAPKNVRIENNRLICDPVPGAGMYEIRMCLLGSDGTVVKYWQGVKTDTNNESLTDIVAAYKGEGIPQGEYCFQMRAATAHNGSWVAVYASDYSARSAGTVTVS
jgi:hypothetical protein